MKQTKGLLRRIVVLVYVCAVFVPIHATSANSGVTFLFSNGQKASFTFASKPEIAIGTDKITVWSADVSSVNYTFSDVERFYFEDDIVTGVTQTEVQVEYPVFSYRSGIISVKGLRAGESVSVYSLSGCKVNSAKAGQDGIVRVDFSAGVTGEYIVNTGRGISFKILKK